MDSKHCATCGKQRGVSPLRQNWSLGAPTVTVPRTDNPDDHPAQISNDLICNASVWRNGGTDGNTHLCDECLRIGLRAIKVKIDGLLGEIEGGRDKDAELAELTQRLGVLQLRHYNICFAHDRMQTRLQAVLARFDENDESEDLRMARFEVARGHVTESREGTSE